MYIIINDGVKSDIRLNGEKVKLEDTVIQGADYETDYAEYWKKGNDIRFR